ncbi:MAG: 50S ribosomal protein L25, partial [Candidatus Methylopumilus sp.]|nr:50S ribosomal protein L25 [Candidatus Methylopumilus sp.]
SCLAKDLPEFVEVDLAKLEIGHSIHLSQITLPKGVEFVQLAHGNDLAVASIAKTRGSTASAADDAAAAGEETPAA